LAKVKVIAGDDGSRILTVGGRITPQSEKWAEEFYSGIGILLCALPVSAV